MGKQSLRITFKSKSKCKAEINRKNYLEKQKHILAAVTYCLENDCKGKKAFPLVKDHKTITRRLDGEYSWRRTVIAINISAPRRKFIS